MTQEYAIRDHRISPSYYLGSPLLVSGSFPGSRQGTGLGDASQRCVLGGTLDTHEVRFLLCLSVSVSRAPEEFWRMRIVNVPLGGTAKQNHANLQFLCLKENRYNKSL